MDDQNQTAPSTPPADAGQAADSGTGTIFAPATADTSVNPYDLTPSPGVTPPVGTPPPVFAQPTMPAEPAAPPADNAPAAPADKPDEPNLAPPSPAAKPSDGGDLMAIKKSALQNLTPLVDDLQQTPEDHFKTMMMLIQASDDSSLIKKAYDAAGGIKDDKVRAQALLDVVNEINYFTQAKSDDSSAKT